MITTLAVANYRSLRDVVVGLGRLTVVTGANGSGKTSLYRSLRLLADIAQGRLVGALASEGGFVSTLWAGPESIGRAVRAGHYAVEGTRREGPVSLRFGFASDDYGYAVDLGYPTKGHPFPRDAAIKTEAVWVGPVLSRAGLVAERRGPAVQVRRVGDGAWRGVTGSLSPFDSMVTHCANAEDGGELLTLRERMRGWRFYDALRADPDAPARRGHVLTYTPILAGDGRDLAAALATIMAIGEAQALEGAVEDAFPGSRLDIDVAGPGGMLLHQHGLLRPLGAAELSDGTLRYLLLLAALLSPRPPEVMVLNEPEASLHPSLLEPLARALVAASSRGQVVVVSHNAGLIDAMRRAGDPLELRLDKDFGETRVGAEDKPGWIWPKR